MNLALGCDVVLATAEARFSEIFVRRGLSPDFGCTYLLPTLVHCTDPLHPLARTELLFPFAAVVQVPQDEMLQRIEMTLVGTGITDDDDFRRQLLGSRNIDRLNLGPVPTIQLNWLQPHEGNIVDFLYRGRAFQMA